MSRDRTPYSKYVTTVPPSTNTVLYPSTQHPCEGTPGEHGLSFQNFLFRTPRRALGAEYSTVERAPDKFELCMYCTS